MGSHYQGFEGFFEVAPDRSIWFNPIGDYESTGTECDGIANFDGQVLHRYLRDHCITAMDRAPDGTLWLRAFESALNAPREGSSRGFKWIPTALVHTYAITPEAVAAAE